MNKEMALKNLIDLDLICRNFGAPCWIQDGTLLGYVREKDFISHDLDTDMGMMMEDFSPKLIDLIKQAEFIVNFIIGYPENSMQVSLKRHDIKTDIFLYYKENDRIYHSAFDYKKIINYYYNKFNLKEINFLGHNFLVPESEMKFILTKYGENWKTPDENWDYAYSPKNHVDTKTETIIEEQVRKIDEWIIVATTKPKKVITYGTFDTFHYGHLELLRRAKKYGHLTVGLSTDEFNRKKGKESKFSYEQRYEWLKSISYVDEIIPETNWEQKENDIKNHNIDIMVMGDDWVGKFSHLPCRLIYLSRTPEISSTKIKNIIQ